jgi:putative endonuclease
MAPRALRARKDGSRREAGMTRGAGQVRQRQPCVYMMASGYYGTLYVGVTSDLLARVMQHRLGAFHGFTDRYAIKRLVWYELADTMEGAIATEKRIKRWHRGWKIELIERNNPAWSDLAIGLGLPSLA